MSSFMPKNKYDSIVQKYLYNVSTLMNHNHFLKVDTHDSRWKYFHSKGFQALMKNQDNAFVVAEEHFLEGCTRVFLVNPIMDALFEHHQIRKEWRYGRVDSGQFSISNREYELDACIEFIIEIDGKNIGCRYTSNSYSVTEMDALAKHSKYQLSHVPIPGFDVLSPIDEVWAIDWSGISDEDLSTIHPILPGLKSYSRDISIAEFIRSVFSDDDYDLFASTIRQAIYEAQRIIALKAVPQLLPSNMLTFKDVIMQGFSESELTKLTYQFKPDTTPTANTLTTNDVTEIKKAFWDNGYCRAIIGNTSFAKSFITSEYLYRSISDSLGIDYTAVVVGYLKSVEQLMQMLYESAFEGKKGMCYWDCCRRDTRRYFDDSLHKYRLDPYKPIPERKQEYYYHKICLNNNAMDFGGLALFLRYYDRMWNVSESGKEYIWACLDDYRDSCRNSHFHKENINYDEYSTVRRIRNNTYVLLYYLLGAFKLLDTRTTGFEQLGVLDYSFDHLYQNIWQKRRELYWIKIRDGYEGIIAYLNQGNMALFDETGRLEQASLCFVMFPAISRDEATIKELNTLRANEEYVRSNTLVLTRNTAINSVEPFVPKQKK